VLRQSDKQECAGLEAGRRIWQELVVPERDLRPAKREVDARNEDVIDAGLEHALTARSGQRLMDVRERPLRCDGDRTGHPDTVCVRGGLVHEAVSGEKVEDAPSAACRVRLGQNDDIGVQRPQSSSDGGRPRPPALSPGFRSWISREYLWAMARVG
jgi:hypothetical protein